MKKYFSICLFTGLLFLTASCQQCHRCGWINRNPVTPKDQYYEEYYESVPLAADSTSYF